VGLPLVGYKTAAVARAAGDLAGLSTGCSHTSLSSPASRGAFRLQVLESQ
jgi:hypothetical protein